MELEEENKEAETGICCKEEEKGKLPRTKSLVEDVGRAFVADLEQGETAPAPRDGAISEPVMSAGGETAPPDSDRGEHRTHKVTGRRSTRRHRSQSTPANGNSCSTEKCRLRHGPRVKPASFEGVRVYEAAICAVSPSPSSMVPS